MTNEIVINVKVNNKADFDPIKTSLRGIGEEAEQASEKIGRGFDRARESLGRFNKSGQDGDSITRKFSEIEGWAEKLAAIGSTFMSSFVKGLDGAAESAADFIQKMGQVGVTTAATDAAGTAASGGMNLLVGALIACAAAIPIVLGGFAALAPAILAAGGAAGATTTLLAGAGIALATLGIGFGGIGAALSAHTKQMGAAGGAAKQTGEAEYQAARRIRDATRAVTDAKEAETEAAKAVNQARADEIDRLRELDLALRGQKVSQAEAAQALVEAKEKAKRADQAGSDWEKAEAKNAVDRAQFQYDSVSEKLEDLTEEKKKADKQGVEGSDQVQAALKRQAQAHDAVIRANEQLADAQHKVATSSAGAAGGVNLFDQAMAKLSPNAQKLVYALLDIEKRFDAIKRRVQDRLLAGFDKEVTDLADKWLPHLDDILGGMADHLNKFGKGVMHALGDSEFIKNIQRAGEETGKFIDKMGNGTDHLIDAFGRLAGHSGPVLQVIGKFIEKIFVWFDKWIKSADESGGLDSFMQTAADTLQKVFDIVSKVTEVFGKFIAIIFPDSKKAGDSVLDGLSSALDKISAWLDNPSHQKEIKNIANALQQIVTIFVKGIIPTILFYAKLWTAIVSGVITGIRTIVRWVSEIPAAFSKAWNWVEDKTASIFNWISRAGATVGSNLYGMWTGLKNGFRDALNWVIARWNNLRFPLPAILGGPIETPNLPFLAHGGIAGGLAMVGERGRELVRLPQGSTVIPNGGTEQIMSQHGGAAQVMLGFDYNSGNALMRAIVEGMQDYVKTRGGNVQVALGRNGAR